MYSVKVKGPSLLAKVQGEDAQFSLLGQPGGSESMAAYSAFSGATWSPTVIPTSSLINSPVLRKESCDALGDEA